MGQIQTDKIYYTYSDVTIKPSVISNIEHRGQCNPFDERGMLPIFTAPMDSVVNMENFDKFFEEGIYPILPRTIDLKTRIEFSKHGKWAAYSLDEFEENFCQTPISYISKIRALIDVANGHMKKILDLVAKAKSLYGYDIEIMVGNIANPETYEEYAKVGADYIRIGIGSGLGCITQSNTAIGCGMATLVDETVRVKERVKKHLGDFKSLPKIIADGGIRNYSDIIKALAIGADYVMCGGILAQMLESAAVKTFSGDDWYKLPLNVGLKDLTEIRTVRDKWYAKYEGKVICLGVISATFYGMASREGQIALNGAKTKTSEGIKKKLTVSYTMHGWCENFKDFLCSSMSYLDSLSLSDIYDKATVVVNSPNAIAAVNK